MRRLVNALEPADLTQVSQAFTLGMTRDVALYSQTAYTAQGLFGVDLLDLGDPSAPVSVDSLSPGCLVLGTDVHGRRLYVSQLGHRVSIYELSGFGRLPTAQY